MTIGSLAASGLPTAVFVPPVAATLATAGDAPLLPGLDGRPRAPPPPPAGRGMPAPSAWSVLSGNFVLHVEQTGVGLQKTGAAAATDGRSVSQFQGVGGRRKKGEGRADALDRQTEQT